MRATVKPTLLHVFRNTPRGAETFRQSLYFGRQLGAQVCVFFPVERSFVLCLKDEAIHVDLDATYLYEPDTAKAHARAIAAEMDAPWTEQVETGRTASTLPNLKGRWDLFSLPRSVSAPHPHPWIPSAVMGPKVRNAVMHADMPVLLPAACFMPWYRVDILYGGSKHAARAVAWGAAIAKAANTPVRIITSRKDGVDVDALRKNLEKLATIPELTDDCWVTEENRSLRQILQELPRTSLVVLGAYGQGGMSPKTFGSKAEQVLKTLPQNLLMIGPRCSAPPARWEEGG